MHIICSLALYWWHMQLRVLRFNKLASIVSKHQPLKANLWYSSNSPVYITTVHFNTSAIVVNLRHCRQFTACTRFHFNITNCLKYGRIMLQVIRINYLVNRDVFYQVMKLGTLTQLHYCTVLFQLVYVLSCIHMSSSTNINVSFILRFKFDRVEISNANCGCTADTLFYGLPPFYVSSWTD